MTGGAAGAAAPRLRKAVIPAAGFGTRFLPFTKAVPKELIPLVDRPVIQYVVEEALAAGIEEILIILSGGKEAIIRHFDSAGDLERRLEHDGKTALLDEVRSVGGNARIHYVYQRELNGLGGAVLEAEAFVGGEPFAVLLGDTVMTGSAAEPSVTAQLARIHGETGGSVIAVEEVPLEAVRKYGVIGGVETAPGTIRIDRMIEKPAPEEAPSRLAVAARYILPAEIFAALRETPRGKGGEIQLTDAIRRLIAAGSPFYGRRVEGRRHDIGNKLSFLKNTIEFGLARPEFHDELLGFMRQIVAKESPNQK